MDINTLIEIDLAHYKSSNPDLQSLSDDQLIQHYYEFGYNEGRLSHKNAVREGFLEQFSAAHTLEIGPFANPALRHENVKYVDVLSSEDLKKRAASIGIPIENIPEIDYVAKDGNIDFIDEKFDIVFSSHCIEHQPDLIAHLNSVGNLLSENGSYALIIPHARYCFDASLPLSKISEILNAHMEKRKLHTLGSVIEHYALTTHNDTHKHWTEPKASTYVPIDRERVRTAIQAFKNANGGYIDVHAWQFDPMSFADIMNTLIDLNYIPFRKAISYGPVHGQNEFTAMLHK